MNPGPRCGGSVAGALNLRNQAFAGRRFGLVLGDVAALQDEFADGKQEKKDKNGVEFGGEESVDHDSSPYRRRGFVSSTISQVSSTQ
jgi:hypothetical protein